MAIVYFAANDQSNKISGLPVLEYSATLSTPGAGDTIMVPDNAGKFDRILCGLIISSGNGRIEYTLSSRDDIESGAANWKAWDAGNVSVTTDDALEPVQAIRGFNVSGTIKLEAVLS